MLIFCHLQIVRTDPVNSTADSFLEHWSASSQHVVTSQGEVALCPGAVDSTHVSIPTLSTQTRDTGVSLEQ